MHNSLREFTRTFISVYQLIYLTNADLEVHRCSWKKNIYKLTLCVLSVWRHIYLLFPGYPNNNFLVQIAKILKCLKTVFFNRWIVFASKIRAEECRRNHSTYHSRGSWLILVNIWSNSIDTFASFSFFGRPFHWMDKATRSTSFLYSEN